MNISLIVAVSENNVIGKDNDLPWKLPDDMKFFKETTTGHHILMGRKNLESLGRLLPNRTNIILTRDNAFNFKGAKVFHDIEEAIKFANENKEDELMVIRGGEIYKQTISKANKIYLTRVHTSIEGDVYFPEIDKEIWKMSEEYFHPKDERHEFSFTFQTFERRNSIS
jgi:dihydrofolate reductase